MKTRIMLPLLVVAAAFVSPASANWFHNTYQNINRNVGSAPNPTPADLREMRVPIIAKDEVPANAPDASKSASNTPAPVTPAQGSAATVATAAPSR